MQGKGLIIQSSKQLLCNHWVPAKFGEVAFNTIREAHFCDFFSIYWDLSWLFEFLKIFMLNGKVEEKV